jgi:hypothetical protein
VPPSKSREAALKVSLSAAKGKRMASSDPPQPLIALRTRFARIMRWGGIFAAAVALLAVALVAHGDPELHIHMLIATGLGVGLMVLLGIALMTLAFLSNSSGHDEEVAQFTEEDDDDSRP